MDVTERFSSRWGLVLASLGMAVGAGNIWRFPRVAAENGGGAFIVAWLVALFVWSIPLLVVELWMGQRTRMGPMGAFFSTLGKAWTWVGGFIAFCSTAIMFYYSVVSGWCVYYLAKSASLGLDVALVEEEWNSFAGSGWSVLSLILSIVLASGIVLLGIKSGIERVLKILIPLLFAVLLMAALYAISLPGSSAGLDRLFSADFYRLMDYRVWLEAFSQSAWSTGAGWGLLLVYSGYSKSKKGLLSNAFITGFGNNLASILAALAIVPTIFALLPAGQAEGVVSGGNEGLAFIWMPKLFLSGKVPGGSVLLILFFSSLAMAAISSLIAMLELGVRTLMDLGLNRRGATLAIGCAGIVFGLPSSLSMDFFKNQDWVWGLGLLLSGALFALGAVVYGIERVRQEIGEGLKNPVFAFWFELMVSFFIPLAFLAMLVWWFYRSFGWEQTRWLNPFVPDNLGTCFAQWGLVLVLLLVFGNWFSKKISASLKK